MDGFRPGGHLSFDRLSDGSVVLMRLEKTMNKKERVRFSHVITADVWAELIAYVSYAGYPTTSKEKVTRVLTEARAADMAKQDPGQGSVNSLNVHLAEAFHAGTVESWKPKT